MPNCQKQGQIGLIHTVPGLIPLLEGLFAEAMPDWSVFNIADETLLKRTIAEGALSKDTMRRLLGYIWSAVDAGADCVVVTCSSLGDAVEAARPFCPVPLFRIDQGMAEAAVAGGAKVGVLATLSTTLTPTTALIENVAARAPRPGQSIVSRVCDGAFDRLSAGDTKGHDAAVADAIAAMSTEVDVIVLAQASMARAMVGMEAPVACPVLTSPELGVHHIRDALAQQAVAT